MQPDSKNREISRCPKNRQGNSIHKGKNTDDPNNYRPITLLSGLNKVIEKVIYNRV